MHRALTDTDSLEELAAEGKRMPVERLKQLESQLPLTNDVDHDTGVFDALVHAMNQLAENEPAWLETREKAAAAAAHVILYRAIHRSMYGETGTPEFWASVEEHSEAFKVGRIRGVPADEFRKGLVTAIEEASANGPKS
jgi:hypothetical protein